MATNLKAKKKKGTYDNKLILWISAGLAAFVILVVGIFAIVTYSTNYVAKVDGEKIYTYEYKHFLQQAIGDKFEKPEGFDEMSAADQEKAFNAFFTDTVKKECQKEALEEARKFKAQYSLALDAGFELSSEKKAEVKNSIDYYLNMYVSSYGLTEENAVNMLTGGVMKLSEYKEFSILQATIENYKNHLKEGYKVTTEEMKELYDKDPDAYRTLTGRVFQFALPTKPSVPKDDEGKEIDLNSKDEKWASKIDTYNKSLAKYEAGMKHYNTLCQQMEEAFAAGDKFTLYDYEYSETEKAYVVKKDKDGKEVELSKDATFETLCALSAWSQASQNKGSFVVGAGQETAVDEINEYILQMQWNEARDGFIFVEKVEDEEDSDKDDSEAEEPGNEESAETSSAADTDSDSEEKDDEKEDDKEKEEDKVKPSTLKRIEVKNDDDEIIGLYLIRVEDINDFDTEVEQKEDSEEETLNTVQSTIKSEILEDKAVADLDKKVAAEGDTFKVESIKQERLDEILAEMFAA